MNFFSAVASFFSGLFKGRNAVPTAPGPTPTPQPSAPVAAPTPEPTPSPAPPIAVAAPSPPPAVRSLPSPCPADLVPPGHYPSNKLGILGPEFRFYYTNGDLVNTSAFRAAQSKALQATWGDLRSSYQQAASILGCVPWWALACLHHMECDSNPAGGIDNGDPWSAVTVHVPAGRGPYSSLVAEMVDAIKQYEKPENWGQNLSTKNWTDPGWVFFFYNSWNGFLQATKNGALTTPPYASAYIYSGYQINGVPLYEKGKDVQDNEFDPEATSSQLGCMAYMRTLENSGIKIF